jgi:hypothetical protein
MANYVIGDDKGLTPAYTKEEIDSQMSGKANTSQISTINSNISTINRNISTINSNLNGKQKAITSGTAAPSGGSNGDIYIQY